MRRSIRHLTRGRVIETTQFEPTTTVLDHLRLSRGLVGTKEGCAEGDCGACTVALGRLVDGRLVYEPITACIRLLGTIDGCELVTIEDLAADGVLHPIQRALVEHHGSQCGFCTPGIVMSLFTLWAEGRPIAREDVIDRLAGNLCRCTGYRPIVDAMMAVAAARPTDGARDAIHARAEATRAALAMLEDGRDVFVGGEDRFFAAPRTLDTLERILAARPDATVVAGATDVGLWITKQGRPIEQVVHLGRIAGLDQIHADDDRLVIGATVSLEAAGQSLGAIDPDIATLFRRIGSAQIRASGTIGGNIANGSPIGDTPPVLIALGAEVELFGPAGARRLPLEDYFIAYGRQDRRPDEILARIHVPKPGPEHVLRVYKIAKRHDQDISALVLAIRLTLVGASIVEARVACGGMAGTPMRAKGTEAALVGASLAEAATWRAALDALRTDFTPLSDHRASADYRSDVAVNLLGKALAEMAGTPSGKTRVHGQRPEVSRVD